MRAIYLPAVLVLMGTLLSGGCSGPKLAAPNELQAPAPLLSNEGKYMCPYTQDKVLAEWTDKAINASTGAAVGKTAGAFAGQMALRQVPFVGGLLGSKFGEVAGREIAIQASGGMEFIKKTSDISFDSCDDMSVYLYVNYSTNEHYPNALKATFGIYPQMQKRYTPALVAASKQARQQPAQPEAQPVPPASPEPQVPQPASQPAQESQQKL